MVILYELTVLRRLQTNYVFSVIHTAQRYLADNGSRSRNRRIDIAVSLKTSSKGTCQENFTTVRECFGLGIARVKALGALKKRKKKMKMTKLDFHRFQVRHLSDNFVRSPFYFKIGQRQKADLSVFGRIKFITRRNISV